MLKEGMPKLTALAVEGDGLGLEERMNAKNARTTVVGPTLQPVISHDTGGGCNAMSLDAALLAPSKNRSGGRPTSSRDKPPYEITSKRSRFCTICREPGHKSTSIEAPWCSETTEGSQVFELRSSRTSEEHLCPEYFN
jgi:hypothetical protein